MEFVAHMFSQFSVRETEAGCHRNICFYSEVSVKLCFLDWRYCRSGLKSGDSERIAGGFSRFLLHVDFVSLYRAIKLLSYKI